MAPQETIEKARNVVEELRRRGETGQAEVIKAILADNDELRNKFQDEQQISARHAGNEVGNLEGATGQQIEEWVREGRYSSYRVGGNLVVPREIMEKYVRTAGTALELDDLSPEEAARVVAEGRKR